MKKMAKAGLMTMPDGSQQPVKKERLSCRDAPLASLHDNNSVKPDFKVTKDLIKIMNQ